MWCVVPSRLDASGPRVAHRPRPENGGQWRSESWIKTVSRLRPGWVRARPTFGIRANRHSRPPTHRDSDLVRYTETPMAPALRDMALGTHDLRAPGDHLRPERMGKCNRTWGVWHGA